MKSLLNFYLGGLLLVTNLVLGQNVNSSATLNSPIIQNELLLDGKLFASATPILLRVFNEEFEYAVVQLGKRKNKIFLYFKIFTDNVCVKQQQPLEFYFKDGDRYLLKNSFKVNCDGTAIIELSNKDIKTISTHDINTIRFFTLQKDYVFSPSEKDNKNFKMFLNHLKNYRIVKI